MQHLSRHTLRPEDEGAEDVGAAVVVGEVAVAEDEAEDGEVWLLLFRPLDLDHCETQRLLSRSQKKMMIRPTRLRQTGRAWHLTTMTE
jgi:hypothetical protein